MNCFSKNRISGTFDKWNHILRLHGGSFYRAHTVGEIEPVIFWRIVKENGEAEEEILEKQKSRKKELQKEKKAGNKYKIK